MDQNTPDRNLKPIITQNSTTADVIALDDEMTELVVTAVYEAPGRMWDSVIRGIAGTLRDRYFVNEYGAADAIVCALDYEEVCSKSPRISAAAKAARRHLDEVAARAGTYASPAMKEE
jgi:hypothetical protein